MDGAGPGLDAGHLGGGRVVAVQVCHILARPVQQRRDAVSAAGPLVNDAEQVVQVQAGAGAGQQGQRCGAVAWRRVHRAAGQQPFLQVCVGGADNALAGKGQRGAEDAAQHGQAAARRRAAQDAHQLVALGAPGRGKCAAASLLRLALPARPTLLTLAVSRGAAAACCTTASLRRLLLLLLAVALTIDGSLALACCSPCSGLRGAHPPQPGRCHRIVVSKAEQAGAAAASGRGHDVLCGAGARGSCVGQRAEPPSSLRVPQTSQQRRQQQALTTATSAERNARRPAAAWSSR